MRLLVPFALALLCFPASASRQDCASALFQTAGQLHNFRLPLAKRLRAARQFRDHALPQLDRAGVLWADMPERPDTAPLAIPGFSVVPVRNGNDLNEFAANIADDYGAHYDFDLGYLATRMAGAAVRFRTTYASLLGSKEAVLHLTPGAYERHELDHLDIDDRRAHGIASVFHGSLNAQPADDPHRVGSYPAPAFDELYAQARDIVHAVQWEDGIRRWASITTGARRLRRLSARIRAAAHAAIAAMDQGEDEGWFEWQVLRQRPHWRIPIFRFLNVPGQPQIDLADYAEPVSMEPSRFPAVQVPKLTTQLLAQAIPNRRMLALAKRTIGRLPPEFFTTEVLLTTPELVLRTFSVEGGSQIEVRVLDGTEWRSFDASVAASTAYVTAILGDGTDHPKHRLPSYDHVFRVARARFERLAGVCDTIRDRSDRIVTAARNGNIIEVTDVALSFEPFLESVDDGL